MQRLAPALFWSEVNAALLKRRRQGQITPEIARGALTLLLATVSVRPFDALMADRALEIADGLALWKAYDSLYVALAEREGCELWTGDERFYNAAHAAFPWVRWLGELPPAVVFNPFENLLPRKFGLGAMRAGEIATRRFNAAAPAPYRRADPMIRRAIAFGRPRRCERWHGRG